MEVLYWQIAVAGSVAAVSVDTSPRDEAPEITKEWIEGAELRRGRNSFDADDLLWRIVNSYSRCVFRRRSLPAGRRRGRGGKPAWPTR